MTAQKSAMAALEARIRGGRRYGTETEEAVRRSGVGREPETAKGPCRLCCPDEGRKAKGAGSQGKEPGDTGAQKAQEKAAL